MGSEDGAVRQEGIPIDQYPPGPNERIFLKKLRSRAIEIAMIMEI
jgi:hypothetical protein